MHALPVVSTTVGAEGLTFEDGSEIIIADDPAAFAQACTRLFGNVQTRREIGHAAQERARREHAPQVVRDRVLSICTEACRAG